MPSPATRLLRDALAATHLLRDALSPAPLLRDALSPARLLLAPTLPPILPRLQLPGLSALSAETKPAVKDPCGEVVRTKE